MYWKQGKRLAPLLTGGGQENNQRSGTENVPAIVAMAKALRLHLENEQQRPQHVATLRSYLLKALEEFQNVTVFSQDNEHFAPHIFMFCFERDSRRSASPCIGRKTDLYFDYECLF